jgi:hypothetical protein
MFCCYKLAFSESNKLCFIYFAINIKYSWCTKRCNVAEELYTRSMQMVGLNLDRNAIYMLSSIVVFLSPSWKFRNCTSITTLLFLSKFHLIYYLFLYISLCDLAAGNVVKITKILLSVEFKDLRAEVRKNPILWGIRSRCTLKVNQCLRGKFRLLLKSRKIRQARIQLETDDKQIRFTLVTSSDHSSTLKTKGTGSSEASFDFQRTTRRYIPRRDNSSVAGYSCV